MDPFFPEYNVVLDDYNHVDIGSDNIQIDTDCTWDDYNHVDGSDKNINSILVGITPFFMNLNYV